MKEEGSEKEAEIELTMREKEGQDRVIFTAPSQLVICGLSAVDYL